MSISDGEQLRVGVYGDGTALAHVDELARHNPVLPRLAAVRAHLLERLGRPADAAEAYGPAIRETRNIAERQHLRTRLRRLG